MSYRVMCMKKSVHFSVQVHHSAQSLILRLLRTVY